MEYSGAGGKLIHDKNQKQKISWHCPFNTQRDFSENKTGQYTLLCSIFSKTVTVKSYTIWRYCPFKRDDYIKYHKQKDKMFCNLKIYMAFTKRHG